jgi:hypothetical protein
MALLKCIGVNDGLRSSEATVTIREYDGTDQYLPIDRGVLSHRDGEMYLSVSLIHLDDSKGIALVGLPVEADSGAHRIWVNYTDLAENPSPRELVG